MPAKKKLRTVEPHKADEYDREEKGEEKYWWMSMWKASPLALALDSIGSSLRRKLRVASL